MLTVPAISSSDIDSTNGIIVLNNFKDELGDEEFTPESSESIYPLRDEKDEEEDKQSVCR